MFDDPVIRLGDVVVVGGGCYGTFYSRQLAEARNRGKLEYERVLVVDHDPDCRMIRELGEGDDRTLVVREWNQFFDDYLGSAQRSGPGSLPHHIVPSPLMPPLLHLWLVRRAQARWPGRRIETHPLATGPGTPYDTPAPDGTRYVSFADWICPTHCVEPALCPVIRGPRTWEMAEAVTTLTERLGRSNATAGPVLFECRHQAFAVGTFAVDAVLAGDEIVAQAGASGAPIDVLVGSISACHGALSLLHLGTSQQAYIPSGDPTSPRTHLPAGQGPNNAGG